MVQVLCSFYVVFSNFKREWDRLGYDSFATIVFSNLGFCLRVQFLGTKEWQFNLFQQFLAIVVVLCFHILDYTQTSFIGSQISRYDTV